MKVAYLLGSLGRGGTETLTLDIFNNLSTDQYEALGFYRKTGTLESDFLKCNVPMIYLSNKKNYFVYLKQLRTEILKNKVNIIHAQQPIDALNARLACVSTKIPVVLTLHGYDFKQDLLWMTVLRLILPFTSKNIFVSKTQRKYFIEKFHLKNSKQVVVYNGISFDKFNTTVFKNADNEVKLLRNELKLKPNTLILGTVGNFIVGRDQLTLCKFINLLKDKIDNFHFVFVGGWVANDTNFYDECVSYCEQNNLNSFVSFLGTRSDVPQLLPQFDAFLYATDHDTFGIGVVEAMAAQIPVFVNDWGVMNEITENGEYANLYKTKEENDLLQKFMLFLQDKSVFAQKAIKASTFVQKKFSIENHITNLKNEYITLTN